LQLSSDFDGSDLLKVRVDDLDERGACFVEALDFLVFVLGQRSRSARPKSRVTG
jgi:hypothetical protein